MVNKLGISGSPQRFSDYPSVEHKLDYRPAREFFQQRSRKIKGLLGLYEYGSVNAPGISDIDLIAVISSDIQKQEMIPFLTGQDVPTYVKRVLDSGKIKPMSETQFAQVNLLGPIKTKPIYAPDPITPEPPNTQTEFLIDVANVFDWLPERIIMLRSLLNNPVLPCRRVLGALGSFSHSVGTADKILGYRSTKSTIFIDSYKDLRTNWFTETPEANFNITITLIQMGIDLGQFLIREVTNHLLDLHVLQLNESAEGSIFWIDRSKGFTFGASTDPSTRTNESSSTLLQNIPSAWIQVVGTYAATKGPISKIICQNLDLTDKKYRVSLETELCTILNKRINWINESYTFLHPLGLADMLYRFSHIRLRSNS